MADNTGPRARAGNKSLNSTIFSVKSIKFLNRFTKGALAKYLSTQNNALLFNYRQSSMCL